MPKYRQKRVISKTVFELGSIITKLGLADYRFILSNLIIDEFVQTLKEWWNNISTVSYYPIALFQYADLKQDYKFKSY